MNPSPMYRGRQAARHAANWAAALLLCATVPLAAQAQQTRSAAATIGVSVIDGELKVSSGTAVLPTGASTITWRMLTPGWRFATGSIDFGYANAAFTCRAAEDGSGISCTRGASAPRGELQYRIRLSQGGLMVEPPQPTIYISLD